MENGEHGLAYDDAYTVRYTSVSSPRQALRELEPISSFPSGPGIFMLIAPGSWKCRDLEGSFLLYFQAIPRHWLILASAPPGSLGVRGTCRSQVVGVRAEERIRSSNLGYHLDHYIKLFR